MEHTCKVCGETKDVTEFRRNSKHGPYEPWNLRYCKICTHNEYISRRSDPTKRTAMKETGIRYRAANPEKHAALARDYRARNKEKTKAQNKLNYAVRMGRIQRQPCEVCGTTEKVHAHHISYKPEDWYNVRWMCYQCHKTHHVENG